MSDECLNLLADRLGRLTVVNLQGGETGPLRRYVRHQTLLDLAEEVLATAAFTRAWPHDGEISAILAELHRAQGEHAAAPTFHHALGVIREEYLEFEDEVRRRDIDRRCVAVELVQLGAMAVRALHDLGLMKDYGAVI
jgi:hypothetical protein